MATNSTDRTREPLLAVKRVCVRYGHRTLWSTRDRRKTAVADASFELRSASTLGIVGESGSGKSTLARAISRLGPVSSGVVRFMGYDLTAMNYRELRPVRRRLQMIFQSPSSSLNPRMSAIEAVSEPLTVHGIATSRRIAEERAKELLERCGLPEKIWNRLPDELSGGQQQRVAIARALAVEPKLIIADEPTSALDVSAQARVVNLLKDLQKEIGLATIFVSHDLAIVRHVSQRIAVMRDGVIVEEGAAHTICEEPQEDYTKMLLASSPSLDPSLERERRERRGHSSNMENDRTMIVPSARQGGSSQDADASPSGY